MSKIKPGDRVRFTSAIAPPPVPLGTIGTIGTVVEVSAPGEPFGPFEGRSDIIIVDTDSGEYEFAVEEVEVIP